MEDKRPEEKERPQSLMHYAFRGFYERFKGVPLRWFDLFIGLCVAAIVIVLIVGVLQGRGVL